MNKLRSCAYCGLPGWRPEGDRGPRCQCKYRIGRMGDFSIFTSNLSRETTVAEIRKIVNELLGSYKSETSAVFTFSITKLDPKKIAKADEKRQAAKVADRLLGKGSK